MSELPRKKPNKAIYDSLTDGLPYDTKMPQTEIMLALLTEVRNLRIAITEIATALKGIAVKLPGMDAVYVVTRQKRGDPT